MKLLTAERSSRRNRPRVRRSVFGLVLGLLTLGMAAPSAMAAEVEPEVIAFSNFDITSVNSGETNTCVVLADGTALCWGSNTDGQLGDGTTNSSVAPVAVAGLSNIVGIGSGRGHTCAAVSDQTIKCWGDNEFGQLGNGSNADSLTPVTVSGISTAVEVAVGQDHTCARLSDGSVKCWGNNGNGRLGNGDPVDGTPVNSNVPVDAVGITTATKISAGFSHSCALLSDGTAACWGNDHAGQLGRGAGIIGVSLTPVIVDGLTGASDISVGAWHSCAVVSGSVKCWGLNADLQLGVDGLGHSGVPLAVAGVTSAEEVSAGTHHTCVRLSDGHVNCWGLNFDGRLGNADTNASASPVVVIGMTTATQISSGSRHTCALQSDDSVRCWGSNVEGQLGNGTHNNSNRPARVIGLNDIPPPGPTTFPTNGPGEDQILRLYRAVFAREPDATGFGYWNGLARSGTSLVQIASDFRQSAEYKATYGENPTNEDLVNLLYENVLGRPGDAGGIAFWVGRLSTDLSVEDLLIAFADSVENISITETSQPLDSDHSKVLRLYQAVFGRAPDAGGFEYWVGLKQNGLSMNQMAAQWTTFPEFRTAYGENPTDAELIDGLYQNVLDRPGDAGGIEYWLGRRAQGMSVARLLIAFADSPENLVNTGTMP